MNDFMNDFKPVLEIPGNFEPVFRSQIPEKTSDAFSRQWFSGEDGWKFDESTIMLKVDRTKQKMAELLRRVHALGGDNVIPEWLYSSLYDYIRWVMFSTGVYRISMDNLVEGTFMGVPTYRYVAKTEKIYPKISHPTREDWDPVVFSDRIRIGESSNDAEYCVVMPSMESVKWLNEINSYCNELDEWVKGTYLQTREKLAESKQFLKNIHAQLNVNGNVYMTEEEVRRGLGL